MINGSSTNQLGRLDWNNKQVQVQTNHDAHVGKYKTILRSCSRDDVLRELFVDVEIKQNTYPDFETELETSFTLEYGEEFTYQLPKQIDAENNDRPEIVVSEMEN